MYEVQLICQQRIHSSIKPALRDASTFELLVFEVLYFTAGVPFNVIFIEPSPLISWLIISAQFLAKVSILGCCKLLRKRVIANGEIAWDYDVVVGAPLKQ